MKNLKIKRKELHNTRVISENSVCILLKCECVVKKFDQRHC